MWHTDRRKIKMSLNIVFVEPEIPPNTGNIARTCAATDTKLHLVRPLGFDIDDKHVRRAGLDYWPYVDLEIHDSLDSFMKKYGRQAYVACDHKRQPHICRCSVHGW